MSLLSPPSRPDPSEEAADWLARRNRGDHGPAEQREFLLWLNASDENYRAYAEAEALWERLSGLNAFAGRQLADARRYLAGKRRRREFQRLAAAAVVLLVAGLAWYFDPLGHLNDQTYRTAQGQIRSIDLADGSRLELDTASEVRVHYSRRSREIRLARGRAAFTVAHGDWRPFEVFAGQARVRDIGTQFEVQQRPEGVAVAVLDGAVEISGAPGGVPVTLRRGQGIAFSSAGQASPPRAIDVAAHSAWREGKLVFRARPLREVLVELGRYQPARLSVTDPGILDTEVSGAFPIGDLPQTMQTIAATLPVRITRIGETAWRIEMR